MTDVTVSIVNHENRDSVLESLAALAAARGRARTEVIVVDNVSQDGSAEAIRRAFPDVEVVEREKRAGYGANHNVAIRRARGRHVLLLNDDARVGADAIDALCRHLDEHPDVAVAAPTVRAPDGTVEPTLWPRPSLRRDLRSVLRPPAAAGDIGWVTGCALMVRRDALERIGGFDEGFFMYSEEIDLCTRLVDAGHRIDHVPEAEVVHEGRGSTAAMPAARAVEIARSRRRYWRKHYGRPAEMAARFVVALQFLLLAAASAARRRPFRHLLIEALICLHDKGEPGLRERADAFNRRRGAEQA